MAHTSTKAEEAIQKDMPNWDLQFSAIIHGFAKV